jgi:hypothetical protein
MTKALTVSQAKSQLGRLLDRAQKGQSIFLRRKNQLYRIETVSEVEPIPARPFGHFVVEEADPMVALANSAPASYIPEK